MKKFDVTKLLLQSMHTADSRVRFQAGAKITMCRIAACPSEISNRLLLEAVLPKKNLWSRSLFLDGVLIQRVTMKQTQLHYCTINLATFLDNREQ